VNVAALRQHLIDMDNVTLRGEVTNEAVDCGMRFIGSGNGLIRDSIQRTVTAHAATLNGVDGWQFLAVPTDTGATLTVSPPAEDIEKLQGPGFIGVLTRGMHHLIIARGENLHH
jgi:hypothetical protein